MDANLADFQILEAIRAIHISKPHLKDRLLACRCQCTGHDHLDSDHRPGLSNGSHKCHSSWNPSSTPPAHIVVAIPSLRITFIYANPTSAQNMGVVQVITIIALIANATGSAVFHISLDPRLTSVAGAEVTVIEPKGTITDVEGSTSIHHFQNSNHPQHYRPEAIGGCHGRELRTHLLAHKFLNVQSKVNCVMMQLLPPSLYNLCVHVQITCFEGYIQLPH